MDVCCQPVPCQAVYDLYINVTQAIQIWVLKQEMHNGQKGNDISSGILLVGLGCDN